MGGEDRLALGIVQRKGQLDAYAGRALELPARESRSPAYAFAARTAALLEPLGVDSPLGVRPASRRLRRTA